MCNQRGELDFSVKLWTKSGIHIGSHQKKIDDCQFESLSRTGGDWPGFLAGICL